MDEQLQLNGAAVGAQNEANIEALSIQLSIKDLSNIKTKLIDAEAQWSDLGLKLGILLPQLQVIAKNNPLDTSGCMNGVLGYWLHGNTKTPITWQTLIDALKSLKLSDVADNVRKAVLEEARNDIN